MSTDRDVIKSNVTGKSSSGLKGRSLE